MANRSCQQALVQINAKLIPTVLAVISLAQRIAQRRKSLVFSPASESQAAKRKTAIVSRATSPNGMVTSAKTHALQDARKTSATKQMGFAQKVARTASLETNAIRNAPAAAKVAAATKTTPNATKDARQAGVETSAMCLALKALALKAATAKLASQNHASLAAFRSSSKSTTSGSARAVQTIA